MTNDYIVRPTIVDGIEFYVAPSGEAGMSLSGLARLCGVDKSNIRRHLERKFATVAQSELKNAETRRGRGSSPGSINAFDLNIQAERNARVIRDDVCAEVVEYYAFDSEWSTDIAQYSYRKFARLGIRAWIHQVTGYAQANDLGKLAETMNLLLKEVQELRVETREYKAIRRQSDNHFPGLNDMMNDLSDDAEIKALPGGDSDGYFTIQEWLVTRGVTLDKQRLHRFASMAAFTYRSMTQKEPHTVLRKSTQDGKTKRVNAYLQSEFPILSVALTKTL